MKNLQQISMPSGIQLWLEEQLEARGIDASVYSKYISSLLCNEPLDNTTKPKDIWVKNLLEELSAKLKDLQEKGQFSYTNFEPVISQDLPYNIHQDKASRNNCFLPPSASVFPNDSSPGKLVYGGKVVKNRTLSEGSNRDKKLNCNHFDWIEENKENTGCNRDAKRSIRSRSTVKQQTPEKLFRNMAKSLDRKDSFDQKIEVNKSRRLFQQADESANEISQVLWANEKSLDDLTGCDQDLPMDFQQLLESPKTSKMNLDFSRCIGTKAPSSFIQCGTNIISSIWSEKAADDAMDFSVMNENSNDINLSLNFNFSAWRGTNEFDLNKTDPLPEMASSLKPNLWSSEDPNIFNNDSWKAFGPEDKKESAIDSGMWSDVEGTRLLLNNVDNFFSSLGSNIHGSLNALNHNKKDSSFTEVIPKVTSMGNACEKEVVTSEPIVQQKENLSLKKEEEDLLTSMKTHFRPIKQESTEVISSAIAPSFPDGTTFPISNSLDEPNFHRSPGGGLYLDADVNNKYMEFNGAEDDTPSEFVPKFKVSQNEKFCQTEEILVPPESYAESDCDELYFPEDEKLVQSMVEEDEEAEEGGSPFWGVEPETCIKVDGWMATWPATGIWSNEPNINVQQIWCGGSVWNGGIEDSLSKGGGDKHTNTRLRNEWTQEAEELFGDISQHLYLANYMDTQQPKLVEVEQKSVEPSVVFKGVSRDRKRRHWSSQRGVNCPLLSQGLIRSRPLTL